MLLRSLLLGTKLSVRNGGRHHTMHVARFRDIFCTPDSLWDVKKFQKKYFIYILKKNNKKQIMKNRNGKKFNFKKIYM